MLRANSSACWRGYVGTWRIDGGEGLAPGPWREATVDLAAPMYRWGEKPDLTSQWFCFRAMTDAPATILLDDVRLVQPGLRIRQAKPVSRILAVDLSSVAPVEVDYDAVPSPWAIFRGRYLPFSRRYRVPALSTIMLKATLLGTQERVNEQGRKADLLLKPPVRRYGMTEVKSFEQIVEAGYQHAREELTRWLENTG